MIRKMSEDGKDVIDLDFKDELLHNLNKLRQSNILCDITVRAEGLDFSAHRCVLYAASPYFRAHFTSPLQQDQSNVVDLKEIKCAAVKQVLQFMYTGEVKFNLSTAQDLIVASDYLIIPSLKSKASQFLEELIDVSNCFALESFASQYHCQSLEKAAFAYKCRNFTIVVKSDYFKLLEYEKVKKLISNDEINLSQEEEVYDAVVTWTKHDLVSRECFLPELLRSVRLFSMSKYSLRKILEEEELVINNRACLSLVLKGLDFVLFPDEVQTVPSAPRLSLQKYEHVVVLTGGYNNGTQKTYSLVLSTMKWLSLPMMPFPQARHGATVSGGQLYVVGGEFSSPVCCFNPNQNKWSSVTKKYPLRSHCSVVTIREQVYVIGGRDHLHNVDKFDPVFCEWKEVTLMEHGRISHCAVALEEQIYIMAGDDGAEHCYKSVECYNPTSGTWKKIPDISHTRRFAAAATIDGKILIVGGFSDMSFSSIEASCELFDPELNQWSLVPSPIVPRAACGIVSLKGCVYLFGGEVVKDKHRTCKLDSVECYDAKENEWKQVSVMPQPLYCLQASLLLFPKKYTERS